MAEGIVYLDVDDEITSAAQRIRSAPGTKVALVVPYGSRIATSRMNFRLLSREAVMNNRRLSIVSGDAAVRSLAASAGLPVFGTVPEYESTQALPDGGDAPGATAASLAASETVVVPPAVDAALTSDAPAPGRKSQRPVRPILDETTTSFAAAPIAGPAGAPIAGPPAQAPTRPRAGPAPDAEVADLDGSIELPPVLGGRIRAPAIAAVALIALAVVVAGVGAYLFLPSASIALTPRRGALAPIVLTVSADPSATEVDPANGVVPATRLEVPVEAGRNFTTTGVKVKETRAGGSVTFTNYDPTSSSSIPSGSVVSTEGGISFRTLSTLIVPRASFTPPSTTVPSEAAVGVQAVKPGIEGNVPANAIRIVPPGENSLFLAVHNPDPTSGGTHTETPEVSKAEVDKALAGLQGDLEAAFREVVAAGAGAPPDTTLFPDTAVLGAATPDTDPKTLVGQAVATFDLKLKATGTVIAVDPRPVRAIARTRLDAQVTANHRLIEDSVVIDVGDGTVGEDGQITFQATARATQVAIVDASSLRSLVVGKTAAEAEAALIPFGTAVVTLWPDWVSTVTSVDARLTITVDDTTGRGGPGASASPSGGVRPSPSPGRSGGSPGSRSPAPSRSPSAAPSSAP